MIAIVPPPLSEEQYWRQRRATRRLAWWVRGGLVALTLVPVAVFTVALGLDPYRDGRVWFEETHTQLGMPPCSFKVYLDLPCPSCGMTSSFALFIRGDLLHSAQANVAGTLLASLALLFIPWGLASAVGGRVALFRSWETALIRLVLLFTGLMFVRWGIVLAMRWMN